jgi:orotate phosphoribosyltransferase
MSDVTKEILDSIRRTAALQLWQLGAVKVNLDRPFKLTSGNFSPIYLNCRQLISSVAFADLFAAAARIIVESEKVEFDVVAGGETAGIPFAAFLARSFGRPTVYVRKATKEHGLSSLVEGVLSSGSRVILVEDLITDAGSKLHFVNAIRAAGGVVEDVLVVFDRQQGGRLALKDKGIRLHAVTDMEMALKMASEANVISADALDAVRAYLASPKAWHAQRQLAYSK